jgi:hypothetical protein
MKNETTIFSRTLTGLQRRSCLRRQYFRTHRQGSVKRCHLLKIHYVTQTLHLIIHSNPSHIAVLSSAVGHIEIIWEKKNLPSAENFKYARMRLGDYSLNRRESWQNQLIKHCVNIYSDKTGDVRGLSGSTIFFPHYLTKDTTFGKTLLNTKCVILIFSKTFVWNIFHSKKIWARYYHKCAHVSM